MPLKISQTGQGGEWIFKDGSVIVVQRAGDLGALGANAPWGLALAAALLIAIGGVVVILRRRFAMADGNGDGEN